MKLPMNLKIIPAEDYGLLRSEWLESVQFNGRVGVANSDRAVCRLLNAAPRMLKALKAAYEALDQGESYQSEVLEVMAEVREAIAKAEGR